MTIKPYVGVTGFTTRAEVEAVDGMLDELDWPDTHEVMYGVLVSGWTLEGSAPTNPNRYVSLDQASKLASNHPCALNLVHYNNKRATFGLDHQLGRLRQATSDYDGVQLNFAWPNPIELRRATNQQTSAIVLQLGQDALREAGSEVAALGWLASYIGVAHYVLLDMSGGEGKRIDLGRATRILELFKASQDAYGHNMRFGVAGGLDGSSVAQLAPLLAAYPNLSWDAEGKLRDGDDRLDLERCYDYLEASLELIRSTRQA